MPSISSSHVRTIHRLPYLVCRSSRGSLPVYSDVRNGAARYLIQIRNVDGCAKALAQDLKQSLFDPGSPHAHRLTVKVQHQRHIILSGGRFKRDVMAWLTARGF